MDSVWSELVVHHLVDVFHRVGGRDRNLGHAASTAAPADRVTRAALYGRRDARGVLVAVQYRHLNVLGPQAETHHKIVTKVLKNILEH